MSKNTANEYADLIAEQVRKRDRQIRGMDLRIRKLLFSLAYSGQRDEGFPLPREWDVTGERLPAGLIAQIAGLDAGGMRTARNIFALATSAIEEGGGATAVQMAADQILGEDRDPLTNCGARRVV